MFTFIVKGDIDTETNSGAMRNDWQAVEQLAEQRVIRDGRTGR